ncbi:transposase, partial [Bacillus cereus]
LPKRWIVERTFAWLENYRRLWKNCERTLENEFVFFQTLQQNHFS